MCLHTVHKCDNRTQGARSLFKSCKKKTPVPNADSGLFGQNLDNAWISSGLNSEPSLLLWVCTVVHAWDQRTQEHKGFKDCLQLGGLNQFRRVTKVWRGAWTKRTTYDFRTMTCEWCHTVKVKGMQHHLSPPPGWMLLMLYYEYMIFDAQTWPLTSSLKATAWKESSNDDITQTQQIQTGELSARRQVVRIQHQNTKAVGKHFGQVVRRTRR